jgi:hypothetical protein
MNASIVVLLAKVAAKPVAATTTRYVDSKVLTATSAKNATTMDAKASCMIVEGLPLDTAGAVQLASSLQETAGYAIRVLLIIEESVVVAETIALASFAAMASSSPSKTWVGARVASHAMQICKPTLQEHWFFLDLR